MEPFRIIGRLFEIPSIFSGKYHVINITFRGYNHGRIIVVMKTLPKVKACSKLTKQEQLDKLLRDLTGHKVFGRVRGELGALPVDELLEKPSPSATRREFEKWCADRAVMLGLLATLQRDGHSFAFAELKKALENSDYVITGESISVEKTEPGVLIMPKPQETLLMTRWLYTSTLADGISWNTKRCGLPDRGQCGSLTPQLLKAFPELVNLLTPPVQSHPDSPTKLLYPRLKEIQDKMREKKSREDVLGMFIDPGISRLWYNYGSVALFIKGASQSDVLSEFNRDEQDSIATWKFDYPKTWSNDLYCDWSSRPNRWIGFHPESEHEQWSKRWPAFTSRGCACGLGAVIMDQTMFGELGEKDGIEPRYSIIEAPYPQYCEGDLMQKRIVIGFPFGS